MAGEPGPPVDESKGVGMSRTNAPFVIVREELGFISGHVDVHRAFALAAFACEAQIKRLLHGLASPTGFDHVATKHFEEQPGASASAVHFFASDHVAGAHGAGVFATAFTDTHAPFRRRPTLPTNEREP